MVGGTQMGNPSTQLVAKVLQSLGALERVAPKSNQLNEHSNAVHDICLFLDEHFKEGRSIAVIKAQEDSRSHFQAAANHIDEIYGYGAAAKCPELVAAYLATCASTQRTSVFAGENFGNVIYEGMARLDHGLREVAKAIEGRQRDAAS